MQIQTACAIIEWYATVITNQLCTLAGRISLTIAIALVACNAPAPSTTAITSPTPASAGLRPAATTASTTREATRSAPTRSAIASSGPLTLTVWMAEDLAPANSQASRALRSQADAFTVANPDVRIEIVVKKAYGKGGVLDLLTTTQAVLPARLPDLATLDLVEVPQAAGSPGDTGLVQPLDGLLPGEIYADLFPFASQAARNNNRWIAVPFAANIEHMVYNRALVRKAPLTWDEFGKQKGTLLLPLGGDDGFLIQYLGLGATLTDARGQPALDQNATAQVLTWFKRSHEANLMPESALALKTVDDLWASFAAGQVAMAQVSASRYLSERGKMPNAVYAPVPTREGKLATIATGWSFVIVTGDPVRANASARFLQWMVYGQHLAPWLKAGRLLPANRSGIMLAVDPPEYAGFLRDELERAVAMPPASAWSNQADAWRTAIAAVWRGQATPEEAARTAAGVK